VSGSATDQPNDVRRTLAVPRATANAPSGGVKLPVVTKIVVGTVKSSMSSTRRRR
jgi:hypothetical protein